MRLRTFPISAMAVATVSLLTVSLVSCSSPRQSAAPSSSTPAPSSGPIDGTYLAKLCGVPQLEVKNENQAAVCITPQGDAVSIVGDRTFTSARKTDAYRQEPHKCAGEALPPVWFRFYDGPNMFAKANYDEISFTMPVTKSALPPIRNSQSLWDQMTILQPIPVFDDVAPTYCGFLGGKTLWANGGFNFELTAGSTGFDPGDAPPQTPWNSPWQSGFNSTTYDGWTAYPTMALGNGAGGPPAGFAIRTPGSSDSPGAADSAVHAKYSLDNAKQVVTLELSYNGATSTYSVPQQLFKDKFLPKAIADGSLAADDKQVGQVNNFDWRWQLFTNTLTIQKPTAPDGKPIMLNELAQYFPTATSYNDIQAKVKGYPGFNNPDAFDNTLVCAKGFEMYGTLIDGKLFTDLDDYSKWVETEADKTDPRYSYWRCIEAIARSREQNCVASGSEKDIAQQSWNVGGGYLNGAIPGQCDENNAETKAVIAGQRKG
ncbi:hypothetical protein [Mycolicibacterium sp. P1-5]|uniref:hypothetical protein n=1 Tax=Mycolicibacterium sp. P1-5 TaxID=2024617 RepID=UPI0011EE2437|nr:hypothetical protein [Mycolicibacterium sp. P1-5]